MTTATYELACLDANGDYELIGDYPTRLDACRAALAHGTGDYAVGRTDAGHYEENVTVHDDGRVMAYGGNSGEWYTVDLTS